MKSARILVVEDEMIVARDIRLQLVELGYEPVGHAMRGEQAVSMARALRPDLVLMDVHLAGAMDGITAAELIRSQLALPVVFLTAFGGADTLDRAKLTDPFGYILKPFSERELHTVLEMALYRHQAEARLRESELRLRTVFESEPECVKVIGPGGELLEINPAGLALLEADSVAEAVGHGLMNFVVPEHRAAFAALHRRVMAGAHELLEFEIEGRRGTRRWLETHAAPMRDASGRVTSMLGVTRDMTAGKAGQAHLRKLSLAVEQSTQSILITDCDGRIEYVNQAFERITGYARAAALGRHPSFLGSSSNPEEDIAGLWATLRSGQSWRGELINRRADGSEYTAQLLAIPLRQSDGRITNYLQLHDDITDQQRLRAELELHRNHLEEQVASRTAELTLARHQAEAASRAKSAFLSNMSHEIRTPMNAIIGLNELLRRDPATPEQAQWLEQIANASQHLLALINDILDLSKIEAGKVVLEDLPFQPSALFDNVVSIIGDAARSKGLVMEVDTDRMPTWLRGDATRLRQALLNYANNAVKFTETGRVVLRARLLHDSADAVRVRFEVEDTGRGIAADKLPLLFRDFEQVDASTTRQYGGTGLGLAITRRLARLMGGEAGAESRLGAGSTFWFTALLHRSPEQHAQSASQARLISEADADAATQLRQQHAGARVLLAEDNEVNRELAMLWLQDVNLAVDSAVDGREALLLARACSYDLVLMDMQMPNLDGMQASRAIRALPGWQSTPILAMTANAFDDSRRQCEAAGMNGFISKPVRLEELHVALLLWLSLRQAGQLPIWHAEEGAFLPAVPAAAQPSH